MHTYIHTLDISWTPLKFGFLNTGTWQLQSFLGVFALLLCPSKGLAFFKVTVDKIGNDVFFITQCVVYINIR